MFEMYPKWVEGQIVNSADEEEALLLKLHPKLSKTEKPEDEDDDATIVEDPAPDNVNSADEEDTDSSDETQTNTTPTRRSRRARA